MSTSRKVVYTVEVTQFVRTVKVHAADHEEARHNARRNVAKAMGIPLFGSRLIAEIKHVHVVVPRKLKVSP